MNTNTNSSELHPRATAYVFGELTAADVVAFERELVDSNELREAVDSIREAVSALETEFTEEAKQLPDVAHPNVLELANQTNKRDNNRTTWMRLAVAACLLLTVGLFGYGKFAHQFAATTALAPPIAEKKQQTAAAVTDKEPVLASPLAIETETNKEQAVASGQNLRLNTPASTQPIPSPVVIESFQAKSKTQPLSSLSPIRSKTRVIISDGNVPPPATLQAKNGPTEANALSYADVPPESVVTRDRRFRSLQTTRGSNRSGVALNQVGDASGLSRYDSQIRFKASQGETTRFGLWGSLGNEAIDEGLLGGDRFAAIHDNKFTGVGDSPLSTFSIDVDTASYSKVRMYLTQHGTLPPADSVRIEELLNYFRYDYEPPKDDRPFAAAMEIASCPWNHKHRLARIGIKGRVIKKQRPASNLVFLLDVSGSMKHRNKLPLVIDGMKKLVEQLNENDSVAIVVYAGAAGLVLDSTNGDQKKTITDALDRLQAGGSTAGAAGIQLAYDIARDHFITGGTNRVILCTDGDFNVGVSNTDALVALAKENAQSNIFLSVLGYGTGNHNDAMMEKVSNDANGNYAFIDTSDESEKVFVEQMQGTLVTIAKDVKIQIEFNPAEVASYRLIGYENRVMAAKDFDDDKKDAGEIGAGHTVTALYEIVPANGEKPELTANSKDSIDLRYQKNKKPKLSENARSGELLTLKLRYKQPMGTKSTKLEYPIKDDGKTFSQADQDFQFAASVAAFGMLLRGSQHAGDANFDSVEELATAGAQGDESGYRTEFVELVKRAKQLSQ